MRIYSHDLSRRQNAGLTTGSRGINERGKMTGTYSAMQASTSLSWFHAVREPVSPPPRWPKICSNFLTVRSKSATRVTCFKCTMNCSRLPLGIFFQFFLDKPSWVMITLSSIVPYMTHHKLWIDAGSSHWLSSEYSNVRGAGGPVRV